MTSSPKPSPTPSGSEALTLGQLFNIPNILTMCRLLLIPVFLDKLSRRQFTSAFYIFCAAALTDALDGTVARWFNSRTEFGAFLDPFADKLLLVSAFVALTFENVFPGWILSVVVIRDVVIVLGYFMISFLADERIPVRPSYLGKAATFLQIACVLAALGRLGSVAPTQWLCLLYLTVMITALSGLHYAYRGIVWFGRREPEMFLSQGKRRNGVAPSDKRKS
jgi:cardiolipin synthase (CMP-forming)